MSDTKAVGSERNKAVNIDCPYCANEYTKPYDEKPQTLRCPECLFSVENPVWNGDKSINTDVLPRSLSTDNNLTEEEMAATAPNGGGS